MPKEAAALPDPMRRQPRPHGADGSTVPGPGSGCFFGESLARAQVLIAEESLLGPDPFTGPGDGDVTQALWPAGMLAAADHAAG